RGAGQLRDARRPVHDASVPQADRGLGPLVRDRVPHPLVSRRGGMMPDKAAPPPPPPPPDPFVTYKSVQPAVEFASTLWPVEAELDPAPGGSDIGAVRVILQQFDDAFLD